MVQQRLQQGEVAAASEDGTGDFLNSSSMVVSGKGGRVRVSSTPPDRPPPGGPWQIPAGVDAGMKSIP